MNLLKFVSHRAETVFVACAVLKVAHLVEWSWWRTLVPLAVSFASGLGVGFVDVANKERAKRDLEALRTMRRKSAEQ